MKPFTVSRGDSPVILGMPHGGTWLPDDLMARLNPTGRALADTDWHIAALYEGLLPGATVVASTVHRYAIDANRDPAGVSLYPGQNTTTLCPLTDFDGNPIWQPGQEPSEDEILARCDAYHAPYHAALSAEVERVKARHGAAVVYDCHSIRSRIPFLFDGLLPVFSIGTNDGESCAKTIENAVRTRCDEAKGLDSVLNGRFKGGWTTRHYGQPRQSVHAIQMELAQRAYLSAEHAPWAYDAARAEPLRAVLGAILTEIDTLARSGALS
ncbi:N-formylglutamate deformylase [Defluviimonas sp. WL0002]|uniref:N-formylglutamate deformylase n=1 Tax=Albidovulum marisflavi TaxID=2984159 RepID=A0ABT2ZA99_9RHOB|nr:N-formylglutamate deformylase [Defluviimonas sp. WL0002]MCV2868063.1 N-formylglutamate deformylase [Defluviimonas sp. WL0002]